MGGGGGETAYEGGISWCIITWECLRDMVRSVLQVRTFTGLTPEEYLQYENQFLKRIYIAKKNYEILNISIEILSHQKETHNKYHRLLVNE